MDSSTIYQVRGEGREGGCRPRGISGQVNLHLFLVVMSTGPSFHSESDRLEEQQAAAENMTLLGGEGDSGSVSPV